MVDTVSTSDLKYEYVRVGMHAPIELNIVTLVHVVDTKNLIADLLCQLVGIVCKPYRSNIFLFFFFILKN